MSRDVKPLLIQERLHYCLVVITYISQRAPVTPGMFIDANALAVVQPGFVEVENGASILWQESLRHFLLHKAQDSENLMHKKPLLCASV